MEQWIKITITVLVVVALVPTIANSLNSLQSNANVTAGGQVIFGLTMLVLAAGFLFMIYRTAVGKKGM